jgi:hypothetical protein
MQRCWLHTNVSLVQKVLDVAVPRSRYATNATRASLLALR